MLKVWGMLWEAKIDQQTISKTEWILEGIFDIFLCILLYVGDHFGGKMLQKSMPKLDEKLDAILEGILRIQGRGRRSGGSLWAAGG